jgi:hypothetical protein
MRRHPRLSTQGVGAGSGAGCGGVLGHGGIPDEMAAGLTRDAAFPKHMGRPIEYARMAVAIVENPMLNGSTIRLDGGQRFAPK